MRRLPLVLGAVAVLAGYGRSGYALPVTLEDGVAVVTVDPATQDGIQAFTVNGIPHVRTQWFWVRAGGDPSETSLDALLPGAQVASDTDADGDADFLFASFLDPDDRFRIELRLSLAGSPFGPPTAGSGADLAVLLAVVNTSGAPLDVTLFQYTDVDLFNTPADDEVLLTGVGGPNTATVTDTSGLGLWESVWTPRPDAVEAALFDATLASLTDGAVTVLSGATSASGDVTVTVGWSALLAAGGTLLLSQDQRIEVFPIPEPSVLVLLGAGFAGLAAARRRARGSLYQPPEVGR
jgi:hypothetical protein